MTDVVVPLAQFPAGQSPAVCRALTSLLCAVLGTVHATDGTVTALVTDEATAVALLDAAVDVLADDQATVFEHARWTAAAASA